MAALNNKYTAPERISASAVLSAQQGRYEWGVRDCLATALALVDALAPNEAASETAAEYHALTEAEAWKRVVSEGGPLTVYESVLQAPRVDVFEPGDLVFVRSRIDTALGASRPAGAGKELVAFCDDSFALWHWTEAGLSEVVNRPRIAAILRIRSD